MWRNPIRPYPIPIPIPISLAMAMVGSEVTRNGCIYVSVVVTTHWRGHLCRIQRRLAATIRNVRDVPAYTALLFIFRLWSHPGWHIGSKTARSKQRAKAHGLSPTRSSRRRQRMFPMMSPPALLLRRHIEKHVEKRGPFSKPLLLIMDGHNHGHNMPIILELVLIRTAGVDQ